MIGVLATIVDGAPGLGADFGGPPAIVPAFTVLALLVAGVRVTWWRALLIGVLSVAAPQNRSSPIPQALAPAM